MSIPFSCAAVFGDHMILQRDKPAAVWGTAPAGSRITASLAQAWETGSSCCSTVEAETQSDAQGSWALDLSPQQAGGPWTITLTCIQAAGKVCGPSCASHSPKIIQFVDVFFGEVWLAGGQSNMELALQDCENGPAELAVCKDDALRFYRVPRCAVADETLDTAEKAARWQTADPAFFREVSAVAYFFARRLRAALGVPVGILDCCWGGTSVSCWQSRAQLERTTAGQGYLSRYDALCAGKSDAEYDAEMAEYFSNYNAWQNRVAERRAAEPNVTWEILNRDCGLCPWPQPAGRKSPFRPAGLYETMLCRAAPYTLTGFLWYQGEEDVAHCEEYAVLLSTLTEDWRARWGDVSLPFLAVQLPMYISQTDAKAIDPLLFARQREQQQLAADSISDFFLTVLTDCGEFDNIHPLDKQTVGARLAACGLRHAYGLEIAADSPRVAEVIWEETGVTVRFSGCRMMNSKGPVSGFTAAQPDGSFAAAQAQQTGPLTFFLPFVSGGRPYRAVRYAFFDYGVASLFSEAGLPASPWRSDAPPSFSM